MDNSQIPNNIEYFSFSSSPSNSTIQQYYSQESENLSYENIDYDRKFDSECSFSNDESAVNTPKPLFVESQPQRLYLNVSETEQKHESENVQGFQLEQNQPQEIDQNNDDQPDNQSTSSKSSKSQKSTRSKRIKKQPKTKVYNKLSGPDLKRENVRSHEDQMKQESKVNSQLEQWNQNTLLIHERTHQLFGQFQLRRSFSNMSDIDEENSVMSIETLGSFDLQEVNPEHPFSSDILSEDNSCINGPVYLLYIDSSQSQNDESQSEPIDKSFSFE